jgi:hypothetical protein
MRDGARLGSAAASPLVAGEDVRFFGLIPVGVGLAFLIYYFVEGRKLPPASTGSPPVP